MSLSEGLLQHSIRLLRNPAGSHMDAGLRRAVSGAYYALFDHLSQAAVLQIAHDVPPSAANRLSRTLDHSEMKRVSQAFASIPMKGSLSGLLAEEPSTDLQSLAADFVTLQEARHSADYDVSYVLEWDRALELVKTALNAMAAWNRIASTPEAKIFILALIPREEIGSEALNRHARPHHA